MLLASFTYLGLCQIHLPHTWTRFWAGARPGTKPLIKCALGHVLRVALALGAHRSAFTARVEEAQSEVRRAGGGGRGANRWEFNTAMALWHEPWVDAEAVDKDLSGEWWSKSFGSLQALNVWEQWCGVLPMVGN